MLCYHLGTVIAFQTVSNEGCHLQFQSRETYVIIQVGSHVATIITYHSADVTLS